MLENTLFRGVLSNPWHLATLFGLNGSDIVTKSETLRRKRDRKKVKTVYGAEKHDPMTRRPRRGDVRGGNVIENTKTVCVRRIQTDVT